MTFRKIIGGAAMAVLFTAGAVAAQTSTTTVGIPDTGAGSAAMSIALLAGSAAVAIAGAFMLTRRRKV